MPLVCYFIMKETPAWLFSCKFCGIFKNTFLFEHPWADTFDIVFDELN